MSHEQESELRRRKEIRPGRSDWDHYMEALTWALLMCGSLGSTASLGNMLLDSPAGNCLSALLIHPRPQDGEPLTSPDDNQTGDDMIISYSGDSYHTAIEIRKVEYLLQLVIPNLEKHQHINGANVQ